MGTRFKWLVGILSTTYFLVASSVLSAASPFAADVLVVIDESGSMEKEQSWIGEVVPLLEENLKNYGIGNESTANQYGLIGFGDNAQVPRKVLIDGESMGSADAFVNAAKQLHTSGGTEDGWRGIQYALTDYPRRDEAALNIILATDEDRDNTDSTITYESVLKQLTDSRALLNAVVNVQITCEDGKPALGMDSNGVGYQVDGNGGYTTCNNAKASGGDGNTVAHYVNLALENGGAVWDLNVLRQGGHFAQSFTNALLDIKVEEILKQRPLGDLVAVATVYPNPAVANQPITLDGASSFSQLDGREVVSWNWDLDSDGNYDQSGPVVTHAFPKMGEYPVILQVTDNSEPPLTDTVTIKVNINLPPLPPSANAGGPYLFCPNTQPWRLDGSKSENPDDGLHEEEKPADKIIEYVWDLNNDMKFDDGYGAIINATEVLSKLGVGDHIIRLKVTDNTSQAFPSSELANLSDVAVTQVQIRDVSDPLCQCLPDITADRIKAKISKGNTASYVELTWNNMEAHHYAIYRSQTQGGPYTHIADVDGSNISYDDREVESNAYYYMVSAVKANGHEQCRSVEVAVSGNNGGNTVPVFDSVPVLTATENSQYEYQANAIDNDFGDHITYELLTAPAGMTVNPQSGLIQWTPNNAQVASHTVAVRAFDIYGAFDQQRFVIKVENSNQPPQIVSEAITTVKAKSEYKYKVQAVDPDQGDKLTFSLITAPQGMHIDSGTGDISWIPLNTQVGEHEIHIKVADAAGLEDNQQFKLVVKELNLPPKFTSVPLTTVVEETNYQYQVKATDPNVNDTIIYSLDTFPAGMKINPNTGVVNWLPNTQQIGEHKVVIVAADQHNAKASQTFSVKVKEANKPPQITTDKLPNAFEGKPYQITLQANDPNSNDTLTFSLTGPANIKIDAKTGVITWLPLSTQIGSQTVTVQVKDNHGLTTSKQFSILVVEINEAPVATPLALETKENISLNIQLAATDPDGDELIYTIVKQPEHGTVYGEVPHLIYLPNAYFSGNDEFTYEVSDGRLTSSARVTIATEPTVDNHPPEIISKPKQKYTLEVQSGQPQPLALERWKPVVLFDVSGDPTPSWQITNNGKTAVQSVNADPSAFIGDFHLANNQVSGTWRVSTTSDDDYIGFVFGYQNPYQFYLFDWKQNAQTFEGMHAERGMTLKVFNLAADGSEGKPQFWPTNPANGKVLFNNDVPWTANVDYDFVLSFRPGQINITVKQGDQVIESFSVEDTTFTDGLFGFYNYSQSHVEYSGFTAERLANRTYIYPVIAKDPDNDVLKYELINAPEGMSIDSTSGQLIWQVTEDKVGTYPVTIKVTDTQGASDQQAFNLTIADSRPVITTLELSDGFVGNSYKADINAFDKNPESYLVFDLLEAPFGMSIEPMTGQINWIPTIGDLGKHIVVVQVTNEQGLSSQRKYSLNIKKASLNKPPYFTSAANTEAIVGQLYQYVPEAVDPEGEVIDFGMAHIPYGMTMFDGNTIEWVPTADQKGTHEIILEVRDESGNVGKQIFLITVATVEGNHLPEFLSTPESNVVVGNEFYYQPEVIDPDGDLVSLSLIHKPDGMTIEAGKIKWKPALEQTGFHQAIILARDARGAEATQQFEILVRKEAINQEPVITSTPSQAVMVGDNFNYTVLVEDPENDPYSLYLVANPEGMKVRENKIIHWQPTASDIGTHSITLRAKDQAGNVVQQRFKLNVTVDGNNTPPEITSQPTGIAYIGESYQYTITVEDKEGDPVLISIESAPAGMKLDATTNVLSWEPQAEALGQHQIKLMVSDNRGGINTYTYTLHVVERSTSNLPPKIISTPPQKTLSGETYQYQVQATDPEGGVLVYNLRSSPDGMLINETGLISWQTDNTHIGKHSVIIRVEDEAGSFTEQSFSVLVEDSLNHSPKITSVPGYTAMPGVAYQYQITAVDTDGDVLSYQLLNAPADMSVNDTGLVVWVPKENQLGEHNIQIKVADGRGGYQLQTYTLHVLNNNENHSPIISSQPPAIAVVDQTYQYQLIASDVDGDSLSYSITNGPEGLTVGSSGLIQWLPDSQFAEHSYQVSITVSDGQATVTQTYNLTVLSQPELLDGQLTVSSQTVKLGESVIINLAITGGSGEHSAKVTVNGLVLALNDGKAEYTPNDVGRYEVVARVSDGDEEFILKDRFTAYKDDDAEVPVVKIISPDSNDKLTDIVDIVATVEDANLADYRLSVAPKKTRILTTDLQLIAEGASSVNNEVIGQLDPSLLMNGLYVLFLEAIDLNGNKTTDTINLAIEGDLKVGNFSFTVKDIELPLAGIPIQINRTYDSRRRNELLDFGYGWSIDYQNVKVEESRVPGSHWELNQYATGPLGILKKYCVEPQGSPLITVTLPNGDVEKFEVAASPKCNDVTPIKDVQLVFNAVGDSKHSKLEALDSSHGYLNGNTIMDLGSFSAIDPKAYKLTTRNGFKYYLDQDFGITKVIDVNGNTLTYSNNGISHSNGESITFARDNSGKITSITQPDGRKWYYKLNSRSDLIKAINPLNQGVEYSYNRSHGLLDIIDSLGNKLVKNIYDDNGRLIAQEDSNGKRTSFNHDLEGKQSVVTDRNGNTTTYYYDEQGNVTSKVDAIGGVTKYTYDQEGNKTSEINQLGYSTTATYDKNNDLISETDALGNTTKYTYNTRGQELTITDALGNTYINSYDGVGNLLSVKDPVGNLAGNNINVKGLVTKTTDVTGSTTEYSYNEKGQKVTETNALGHTTTFTYDDSGNVKTESRQRMASDGSIVTEVTTYTYDDLDRVIKTQHSNGSVTAKEYDAVGNEVATVDALGHRIEYKYDAYRQLIETRYPDNTTEKKQYDAEGNVLVATDRAGRITQYSYDALNRQTKVIYPDGSTTQTVYDAVGQVVAEIDANGNRTEYEYDAAGRRTLTRDALGNEYSFEYDAEGNLIAEVDANDHRTAYVYNTLGQRIETIYQNDSRQTTTFDALSRRTGQSDQASVKTSYQYDKLGQLIKVIDALGSATTYSYDSAGNKLTQTDAEGRTTHWVYDAAGRVTSRTLPMGQTESFTYDANGNLIGKMDFNGQTTLYKYDSNNRHVRSEYADSRVETFQYDAVGNRTQVQVTLANDTVKTTAYSYDQRNRLISETQPDGAVIHYKYDQAGNRTQVKVTQSNGQVSTTDYSFDKLNRLQSVTDSNGTTTYGYDAVGNRTSVSYPNGNSQVYSYDSLNRLTKLETYNQSGGLLQSYHYTLHPTGRRTQIEEHNGRATAYSYDKLYRLTSENITDGGNGNYAANYQYDKVGNRTQSVVNGVTTQYSYDDNDRLIQQGGIHYSYDANGNTLKEAVDGKATTYRYDAKNKLAAVEKEGKSASYRYNYNGIRIAKTENGVTTNFIVDTNRNYAQVLVESDGTNQINYTYGDDLVSQKRNGTSSYYHYDGLGSTRALSDTTGVITDTYNYEAFGSLLNSTGTTKNNYLFTGEQFDSGLNQYYLRARYYNQQSGRFTQMDSWMGSKFAPNSLNKYNYTESDPANGVDPSGYFTIASVSIGNLNVSFGNVVRYTSLFNQVVTKLDAAITVMEMGNALRKALSNNAIHRSIKSLKATGAEPRFRYQLAYPEEGLNILFSHLPEVVRNITQKGLMNNFLKNKKNDLLIYGPTPEMKKTPWPAAGTRILIGKLSLVKSKRKVYLELGASAKHRGRFIGIGNTQGSTKGHEQWFRMDYHSPHGNEAAIWGNYHAHYGK
ncbi:tandem-95 repeat protein [Endozoicomonas sp. SM1973]|uniref:Tandem-95 repeat protein n=1 Tax=Spartinivicinus marinus TaxID=2994442 RepID=A0A853I919_9GAMM|nr:putative Ig domain-containing protein [Spartinivicinus marinus]MCX4026081.1 putative Ig domain-containing protein [Spartinivicinus marinus]NYZ66564.1 tandem-95 repeat protein [Spartinivicinus marinus]